MTTYNFSAGPSALFPEVVEQIAADLGNWSNTGCSVFEISHRSPEFMQLYYKMLQDFSAIAEIPAGYKVLFLQGGARSVFSTLPLNIPLKHKKALYLTSGHWSITASKNALPLDEVVEVEVAQLTDRQGNGLKLDWRKETENVDYVHYCMNETVDGVEIFDYLQVAPGCRVAVDVSSNILSRPIDISKFDVVYAGAQKNIGVAGVTVIIVKEDLLGHANKYCPEVLNWTVQANIDSMINTPATFSWYTCGLTFAHLLAKFGNLSNLAQYNQEKASLLYDYINSSDFYNCKVSPESRSLMNVVFQTPSTELDAKFVAQATAAGLKYLKGHKVVGGLRASIYNAVSKEAVEALIDFMTKFANDNK